VQFVLKSGVFIGAVNNLLPALSVGDFEGITPTLTIENGAYILGAAGSGSFSADVRNGGLSLDAAHAINIENFGTIAGGGGAGGAGDVTQTAVISGTRITIQSGTGGTAGAGYAEGDGVYTPYFTLTHAGERLEGQTIQNAVDYYAGIDAPISDFDFGEGGGLGQPGSSGARSAGGLAGKAVTNNANINWINAGTIIGDVE